MIKGSIKGADKLLKASKKMANIFESNSINALKESTVLLHSEAVRIVTENSVGKDGRRSDPFESPFKDTGILSKSIKMDTRNIKDGYTKVGSNLKYAAWLEFGTENMAPRPWLSTAVEETSKDVGKIFQKWFDNAMKEISK